MKVDRVPWHALLPRWRHRNGPRHTNIRNTIDGRLGNLDSPQWPAEIPAVPWGNPNRNKDTCLPGWCELPLENHQSPKLSERRPLTSAAPLAESGQDTPRF